MGSKAPRVTRSLSVNGTNLVAIAGREGIHLSRQLTNAEQRARIERALMPFAAEARFVVRTSARQVDPNALADEAEDLVGEVDALRMAALEGEPRVLHEGPGPVQRAIDGWQSKGPIEWIGAGGGIHDAMGSYFPEDFELVEDEDVLLDMEDLDGQIQMLQKVRVDLGDGVWLAIESTEALVAVDVNTGISGVGGGGPGGANRRAAREIPRQLRLRGLGGIVVIDFPPGNEDQDAEIERLLVESMRVYGGRSLGWTQAGNFEIQRWRDRLPVENCFDAGEL